MQNAQRAAMDAIRRGEVTCVVLQNGETIFRSEKRGVAPLLELLADDSRPLMGADVTDKLIGKAAAMLLTLGGTKSVTALVMSEAGRDYLAAHDIAARYETLTPAILNRAGDGPCPMEAAVAELDDPAEGKAAIQAALMRLRAGQAR